MIDLVTGSFEITQYKDKNAMTIAKLVKTTWITRYPWPIEITFDQGLKFIFISLKLFDRKRIWYKIKATLLW